MLSPVTGMSSGRGWPASAMEVTKGWKQGTWAYKEPQALPGPPHRRPPSPSLLTIAAYFLGRLNWRHQDSTGLGREWCKLGATHRTWSHSACTSYQLGERHLRAVTLLPDDPQARINPPWWDAQNVQGETKWYPVEKMSPTAVM